MKVTSVGSPSAVIDHSFPDYRVDFFDNPDGAGYGWRKYSFELTEAHSVHQVLAWADANARGRLYCVYIFSAPYAVDGDDHAVEMWQLCGSDPTMVDSPRAEPPLDLQSEAELDDLPGLKERRKAAERRTRDHT